MLFSSPEWNTPPIHLPSPRSSSASSTLWPPALPLPPPPKRTGSSRMTIYRWMKTRQEFSAALHRARAEFVLARRDDLHHLSNRALEPLLAVLDNPRSTPAVLLRTAMFVLQRPQLPKTGWSMPEPTPDPDGKKLIDSAVIEQDYDSLPGLYNIEKEAPAETPPETDTRGESTDSEPVPPAEPTVPPPSDEAGCYEMLHDLPNCDDVTPAPSPAHRQTGLRSCPVPPDVLEARNNHAKYVEALDMIKSVDEALRPDVEEDLPANPNTNETEEILV